MPSFVVVAASTALGIMMHMNRYHVNTDPAPRHDQPLTKSARLELADWLSEPQQRRLPRVEAYRAAHAHFAAATVQALGYNDLRGALRGAEQALEALRLAEREDEVKARRTILGIVE